MTLSPTINETLKWLATLPISMQNISGGYSVVLNIIIQSPSSPTSWDLGQCQYLLGDISVLNKCSQPTGTITLWTEEQIARWTGRQAETLILRTDRLTDRQA